MEHIDAIIKRMEDDHREEQNRLLSDIKAGLRVAWEMTLETQTVEEACTDLVRLIIEARKERDLLAEKLRNV